MYPLFQYLKLGREGTLAHWKEDIKIAVLRSYKYLNDNRELAAGTVTFNTRRKNKILDVWPRKQKQRNGSFDHGP